MGTRILVAQWFFLGMQILTFSNQPLFLLFGGFGLSNFILFWEEVYPNG